MDAGREEGLGWNLAKEITGKEIEASASLSIRKGKNGKKKCIVNALPRLAGEEQAFLGKALQEFQAAKEGGKKESTRGFLKNYCVSRMVELDEKQAKYMPLLLEKEVAGFGALDFFLENDEIEEIAVIGLGSGKRVHVFHARFGWMETNIYFTRENAVRNLVNKMAASIGRRLTLNSPVLNATLPDGSRLNAAIPPISFTGPSVTIRKFRKKPFTPLQLMENRTFSPAMMAFLWVAMQCDSSLLVAGNTGSGKTSSLNALFGFVPCSERIVVVEETPEIRLPHRHMVKLNVAEEQGIGMQSLIVDTLRMRPDRIVVGEVRSKGEVHAFVDTLLAGQGRGSYATFHSQSCREAVARMKALGVEEADIAALDLLLVQRRWKRVDSETGSGKEERKAVELAELVGKGGKAGLNTLFSYNFRQRKWEKAGKSRRVLEKAGNAFSMGRKEVEKEVARRAELLAGMKGNGMCMEEFFQWVNGNGSRDVEKG